jgi:hypothetical protein
MVTEIGSVIEVREWTSESLWWRDLLRWPPIRMSTVLGQAYDSLVQLSIAGRVAWPSCHNVTLQMGKIVSEQKVDA